MDRRKLGKKIKMARAEKELTQESLAKSIGATQRMISSYESGVALPSLETLENFCIILDKTFSYFLDY